MALFDWEYLPTGYIRILVDKKPDKNVWKEIQEFVRSKGVHAKVENKKTGNVYDVVSPQNPPFPGRAGSGQRFKACVKHFQGKPGIYSPAGLCASIGRKKGVINPGDLNLWGYHRISGNWERLQGPSDESTLKEYEKYFAKTTLSQTYSHVPHSGFSNDSRPTYTKFVISKNRPKYKRNPILNPTLEDAQALFEEFHGRDSTGTIEIAEKSKYYDKLAILGELEELGILEPKGNKITPIRFKPNKLIGESMGDDPRIVWVCAANEHQIEFVDGDQSLDFNEEICRRLDIDYDELEKQMVEVGPVRSIVYFTDKHHLEGPRYQEKGTPYEHKFGEEGGKMPVLFYDTLNDTIMLVGGSYTITPEGIKN